MELCRTLGLVIALLTLVGCASTLEVVEFGERSEQNNTVEMFGASKDDPNVVRVQAVEGTLYFLLVNRERVVSVPLVLMGRQATEVILPPGQHEIHMETGYGDLPFPPVDFQPGHRYLVDMLVTKRGSKRDTAYWMKNMTTGKVVAGRELSKAEVEAGLKTTQ